MKLYLEEVRELDSLIAFGAVQGQLQRCAEHLTAYTLEHDLRTQVRSGFPVRLRGPVGRFIVEAAEYRQDSPSSYGAVGCYNLAEDTIDVVVSPATLELGSMTPDDLRIATHEMVHATSPTTVRMKLDDSGRAVLWRVRSGFASGHAKDLHKRQSLALLALNEGTTESIAFAIMEQMGLQTGLHSSYAEYVEDVRTLRQVLGLVGEDRDELYCLYHDVNGIQKLARLFRERTPLGRHGLALFDLLSTSKERGGFTRFVKAYVQYQDHTSVTTPVTLKLSDIQRTDAAGNVKLFHPPVTVAYLEKKCPFVTIDRTA